MFYAFRVFRHFFRGDDLSLYLSFIYTTVDGEYNSSNNMILIIFFVTFNYITISGRWEGTI